ncbi:MULTISPECIES: hypothetical protein [unclassified Clostridium]|uniref:hypothetical protein n=1 Tax=unclassified Clostridium TaxID=2614128 RepID=UPI00207A96A8|nr:MULTISPECIES: hypothetical protein [unclassified Clostridium]
MKLQEKYIQTKLIKGFEQFNYLNEIFEITDINEFSVMLKSYNLGVGCGIEKNELLNYFKPYISEIEELANKENIKLIFNNNVTVAILDDGSKGISKCLPEDDYNKDKGIEIAITKAKIKSLKKKLNKLIK